MKELLKSAELNWNLGKEGFAEIEKKNYEWQETFLES